MLNLSTIMINSERPQELAKFYTKVLGEPGWSGGEFTGWKAGDGMLMVGPHDKVVGPNESPARLMWNFETADVEAEFKRLEELGAVAVAQPYHPGEDTSMTLATLADPDGNYFQLASPMKM